MPQTHYQHTPRLILLTTTLVLVVAGCLLSCRTGPQPEAGSLTPVELRCDQITNPVGVDSERPRLSWKLKGNGRCLRQTAYEVLVASSAHAIAQNRGDLWRSRKVASDETLRITYAGAPLSSSQESFWKVRVWDELGRPSAWSDVASWSMGILQPSDWRNAHWITGAELLANARAQLGFKSGDTTNRAELKWIQIDLGNSKPIEGIRLHALRYTVAERLGFPRRFKVEAASNEAMSNATVIADQTAQDFRNAWASLIEVKPSSPITGRFVRVTATWLREFEGVSCFALSQIEVLSGGTNVAVGTKVSASDSIEQAPWSAAAITDGLGVPKSNPFANSTLLLRRQFTVKPGLRRAIAHFSGLGQYAMSLNGDRVGNALLTPGWSAYDKTVFYDSYDLTQRLRPGANAVGLILASGFYNAQEGRYVKLVGPPRALAAIGQIRLEYANGETEFVVTDSQWKAILGPTQFANVYGGEDFDARLESAGWDGPGFETTDWSSAVLFAGPGGHLRGASQASPPFRQHETLKPVAVREIGTRVAVYDLGQNAPIMIHLTARGPAGSTVKVIPAELVRNDGTADRGSAGGGEASWNYTLAGRPEAESWTPEFFYHGSRFLQVECRPRDGSAELPVVESLEGIVVHSDSSAAGDFECSNELFNRIRRLIHWAQRSNLAHVLTDCPHREKLGWLEQYHLNGPSLRYEFDLTRLFAKCFTDMADAQTPAGLVPDIAPEYVVFEGGFRDSPEWGSALILASWQHHLFTGDDTPLRANYAAMQRYLAYLDGKAEHHIVSHGLGDWYDLGPRPPGYAQLTPIPLTATAIYYEDTVALAQIAELLGRPDDSQRLTNQAVLIKAAFNGKFFDAANSTYSTGSQTANAMPLVLGLVPDEYRNAVLENLVRDVRAHTNSITAGDVGYRYLLRALADGGRSDVIFDMNNQSEKPGYGYQLARGATSLTEAWNADRSKSQNHFMLGQLTEWLYADLAGIRPDPSAPGFKKIIFKPQPVGDITWAEASYESPHGRIVSNWRREAGRFMLTVSVPPNCRAIAFMPEGNAIDARVQTPLATGARLLRREPGRAVFELDSGSHEFKSTL